MSNIIDVFKDDRFSLTSMSEALQKVYTPPKKVFSLFTALPINTPDFVLDVRERHFNILPLQQRGEAIPQRRFRKGAMTSLSTFRIGEGCKLIASELAFLRQFGTPDLMVEAAMVEMARRQQQLITDHDATLEHMALGAINGQLIDHDKSVVVDFFETFDLTRPASVGLPLATASDGDLRELIEKMICIPIEDAAAGAQFTLIFAECGDDAWFELQKNPEVRETFKLQHQGMELRQATRNTPLYFGGVLWSRYPRDAQGKIALASDQVKFYPGGDGNTVFRDVQGPGETFADLGQYGKPIYARVIPDRDRDTYVEAEVMSYRNLICTRPEMLRGGHVS